MRLRLIAHTGCLDGFSSAFVFKKHWKYLLTAESRLKLKPEEVTVTNAEILPLYPGEIQSKEFKSTPGDVVVDLPRPAGEILFWCDHHATAKPEKGDWNAESTRYPNQHWKIAPSCTGYLIDLAVQNGLPATPELLAFKEALDKIDAAEYTLQEIQECYYTHNNLFNPAINSAMNTVTSHNLTTLQKAHALGAMFNTRDRILNHEIFKTLLSTELGETPLSSPAIWQLNPLMFYRAQLSGYKEWRENVDTYLQYDTEAKCVIQDDRKIAMVKGVADRFYACIKFPESSYNLSLKPMDPENMRVGIGSNIFHKERCKVDLGKLSRDIGRRFGKGSGGGHHDVGGAMINPENADAMIEYVLKKLREIYSFKKQISQPSKPSSIPM